MNYNAQRSTASNLAFEILTIMAVDHGVINESLNVTQYLVGANRLMLHEMVDAIMFLQNDGVEFSQDELRIIAMKDQTKAREYFSNHRGYPLLSDTVSRFYNEM